MTERIDPELLVERLSSDHEGWRADAELRLVELGEAAVEPLLRALRHPSPSVRLHAARALSRMREPRALGPIVAALGDAENFGAVAIAAEKALVGWGAPARPALQEAALRGPEEARPRAIRALGQVGGDELEAPLRRLLADPSAAVRTQAAAALAAAFGERAIGWIEPLLADGDKWVRYGVAEALVRAGSVRGRGALEEALRDPEEDAGIRGWAEELLDELGELVRTGRAVEARR